MLEVIGFPRVHGISIRSSCRCFRRGIETFAEHDVEPLPCNPAKAGATGVVFLHYEDGRALRRMHRDYRFWVFLEEGLDRKTA